MSNRNESRREVMRDAHEGHEELHPKIRAQRVGPRKWMASSELGYDYTETIINWRPTWAQLAGFLITLFGLVAILVFLLLLRP